MVQRWAVLACVALLGCSEAAPVAHASVTDSAGVTLVTNREEQVINARRWILASAPSLELGSKGSGIALFQVTDITRTESGIIGAVNRGSDEVVLFDVEGRFLGRRGREGDGPGEFRWLSSVLALGGDSIGAYDFAHKRLSVFDPSGAVAREFTVASEASDFERVFVRPTGGLAVFAQGGMRGAAPGVFRPMAESFSLDRTGARTGSFGSFPGGEFFTGQVAGLVLFGAYSHAAVVDEFLIVGTAEIPELRFYTDEGALGRIVRWPDHERRVTEERVAQYMTAAEAGLLEAARAQARAMLATVPRSDREPAYEGVMAGPDGDVWVGQYRGPEMALPGARSPAREWLVFDREGVIEARVNTPIGYLPLYVGKNEVIGVFTDELGVETIRVYEVVREPM